MTALPPKSPCLHENPSWQRVLSEAQRFISDTIHQPAAFNLNQAFAQNPTRLQQFNRSLCDAHGVELLHVDASKSHIDETVWQQLLEVAQQQNIAQWRDAMFNGAAINTSEQRQVMHWLLRTPEAYQAPKHLQASWQAMSATRRTFLDCAETIRNNPAITDIVNIGIGGSDLGAALAVQALRPYVNHHKRYHFVNNIDGHSLHAVLAQVNPKNTLFIVSSKSFGTMETINNARTAIAWFGQQAPQAAIHQHFIAITANAQAAHAIGIDTVFPIWDWVGGRFALWSATGLPVAIAIGAAHFLDMLAGAHGVDTHFLQTDLQDNIPILLGLLQVWESSALGYSSRCIAPYHADLQRLPAYLQQLEMESNGKSTSRYGAALPYHTAPTVWGEPGSTGQHAFFQLLRQGTHTIPVEFLAVRTHQHHWDTHQNLLLSNAIAQAQALMTGNTHTDPQRGMQGNRPSTFIVLPQLTPRNFGALLALYEHRTFVCGAMWNINSFDQWGVEHGKMLAKDIGKRMSSGNTHGLDASTANLLQRLSTPQ